MFKIRTIGERIKTLRQSENLTQEQLAESINKKNGTSINKGMISKWENNKEEPRMEYVRNLAEFFDASVDYIICLSDEIKPNNLFSDTIHTIAAHFDGDEYTDKEMQEILDYAKYIKAKRDSQKK